MFAWLGDAVSGSIDDRESLERSSVEVDIYVSLENGTRQGVGPSHIEIRPKAIEANYGLQKNASGVARAHTSRVNGGVKVWVGSWITRAMGPS